MADKIGKQIRQLFETYGHHCHITVRDYETIILSDCQCVNYTELEYMLQQFKCVNILIQECAASKSGFVIILHIQTKMPIWCTSIFLQIMIMCNLVVVGSFVKLANFFTWGEIR